MGIVGTIIGLFVFLAKDISDLFRFLMDPSDVASSTRGSDSLLQLEDPGANFPGAYPGRRNFGQADPRQAPMSWCARVFF